MKNVQEKFSNVVKEGIAPILKNNNFKKKGLNFYKDLGEIGHAIKVQKDKNNSKGEVRFTINIGIFSKPYWFAEYNYDNEVTHPVFPQEPVSIIRKRIGDIKYGYDYWYELESQIIERKVMSECIADCKKKYSSLSEFNFNSR